MRTSLALAIGLFAASAFGANIVANPGFETGTLAPWGNDTDFCGGCLWTVDNADANTGSFSAVVDGNRMLLQTFPAIATSSITALSFWARHPGAPGGTAIAYEFRYSDTSTEQHVLSTLSNAWTFFDVFAELDPGKSLVGFGVFGNSANTARLDDVLIDDGSASVPEPSTIGLCFAGLLAVGLLRRKR